jgi:hypothetical protein
MGGSGQLSQAFSGEDYDFYSVSPEYFGYHLRSFVQLRDCYISAGFSCTEVK